MPRLIDNCQSFAANSFPNYSKAILVRSLEQKSCFKLSYLEFQNKIKDPIYLRLGLIYTVYFYGENPYPDWILSIIGQKKTDLKLDQSI